jgi:imidazolonepropionase-like amidohydrolase
MQKLPKIALVMSIACAISLPAFPAQESGLLIENVTLIDGTGKPSQTGTSVLVQGNRIERVRDRTIQAPSGTRRIDGTGKYLIPGLMDMHVHIRGVPDGNLYVGSQKGDFERAGIQVLHSYLYSGVTSLFDSGNHPDFIMDLRDKERSGAITSPRVFAAGGIVTAPGGHGGFEGATLVNDWPEAIAKLDEHIARKPDMVKLTYEERGWGSRPQIPLLDLDLMQRIIEYYNDRGIRATVHTSNENRTREAIFAGADALSHPMSIRGPITEGFARLMGAKKIPTVSTLAIGENYSRLVDNPEFLDQHLYQATLEPAEIERLKTEERPRQEARPWTWWMKIMTPIAQENLRMVHEQGGIIVTGTDQSLGPALHREMELLVAAGLSPADVIRCATLNAAIFLGKSEEMGSVEEGKLADLVLLDADPTQDIDNAKRIALVIKDGQVVDRAKLDLPVNRR